MVKYTKISLMACNAKSFYILLGMVIFGKTIAYGVETTTDHYYHITAMTLKAKVKVSILKSISAGYANSFSFLDRVCLYLVKLFPMVCR